MIALQLGMKQREFVFGVECLFMCLLKNRPFFFPQRARGMRKLNFLHDVKIFLWVQILVYLVSSLLVD